MANDKMANGTLERRAVNMAVTTGVVCVGNRYAAVSQ